METVNEAGGYVKQGIAGIITGLAILTSVHVALLWSQPAQAARFSTEKSTFIRDGEVVDSSAYFASETITIEGDIKGDLYCAGSNVKISGAVEGDIICAGANIEITGKTDGDIRLAGQTMQLRGKTGGSVTVFGESLETEQATLIQGDLNGAVGRARLAGTYERDIALVGERVTVVGNVGRDIEGQYQALKVAEGSKIEGALRYVAPKDAEIAGTVAGEVKRTEGEPRTSAAVSLFMGIVAAFFGMLLLSFVLAYIMPKRMDDIASFAEKTPGRPLLWGAAASMAIPFAIVLMVFSYVGIVVGVFIILAWLLIVMLSGPMVGYLIGKKVLRNVPSVPSRALVGGMIVIFLYLIPVVNVIAMMVVVIYGSGMILSYLGSRGVFGRFRPTATKKGQAS